MFRRFMSRVTSMGAEAISILRSTAEIVKANPCKKAMPPTMRMYETASAIRSARMPIRCRMGSANSVSVALTTKPEMLLKSREMPIIRVTFSGSRAPR